MNYGSQSWVNKIQSILIKHPKDAWINQEHVDENWESFDYLGKPNFKKAVEEFEIFTEILNKNIGDIYYLPQNNLVGMDSIYAQDSLKITEKGAIYFTLGKTLRKEEGKVTEKYLKSIGIPTLGYIESPGTMEGGDVLWLDEKTACIGLSYRTNIEGINQFKELTKDFVDNVIAIPLPHANGKDEILHLTSLISMIDHDLALVYSEYMPAFFRDMLLNRGIKLIEVDKDEYNTLGSNVLTIEPRKCIMIEGMPKVKKALENEGCKVFTYPGKNLSYYGMGGPTCLTHPIYRKKNI